MTAGRMSLKPIRWFHTLNSYKQPSLLVQLLEFADTYELFWQMVFSLCNQLHSLQQECKQDLISLRMD